MIWFYSGTPGSGKSFHMASDIRTQLRLGRNVISTVDIDINKVSFNGRKKIGDFVYIPIMDLNPGFLQQYARDNHVRGKEAQTLLIIDECQILFNPRDYGMGNRREWILFFTKHRHYGFNIIMTSQFDRLVDRQIRSLFEYEVKHRKVNNFGVLVMLPITVFSLIEYWYGVREVTSRRFLVFNKKIASIYDSYTMFDELEELKNDTQPFAGVPIGAAVTEAEPENASNMEDNANMFIEDMLDLPLAHAGGG
jgi:zona occludens toxin (predicted ATPase)